MNSEQMIVYEAHVAKIMAVYRASPVSYEEAEKFICMAEALKEFEKGFEKCP